MFACWHFLSSVLYNVKLSFAWLLQEYWIWDESSSAITTNTMVLFSKDDVRPHCNACFCVFVFALASMIRNMSQPVSFQALISIGEIYYPPIPPFLLPSASLFLCFRDWKGYVHEPPPPPYSCHLCGCQMSTMAQSVSGVSWLRNLETLPLSLAAIWKWKACDVVVKHILCLHLCTFTQAVMMSCYYSRCVVYQHFFLCCWCLPWHLLQRL